MATEAGVAEMDTAPVGVVQLLDRAVGGSHDRSVGVAVIQGGELAWTAAAGGRAEPLFQAGSLSKTVTSALALQLVQHRELDLDADIRERLVSWQPPTRTGKITLRELLSHTSGANVPFCPGYEQTTPAPTLLQSLNGEQPATTPPVQFDPSAAGRFRYSGGGYAVVQQLIEDVTEMPFAEAASKIVFEPLGMTRSTFHQPPPRPLREAAARPDWRLYPESAAAGLWTIPSDLARFVSALQTAATGKRGALSHEAAQTMTTPHARLPFRGQWTALKLFGLAFPNHHGLGLFVRPDRFINLGGAAKSFSALTGSLNDGTGAIVMTAGCRPPLALRILFQLNDANDWTGIRASPRPHPLQTISRSTSELLLRTFS